MYTRETAVSREIWTIHLNAICVVLAILLFAPSARTQQPGGVSGTKLWMVSKYIASSRMSAWSDVSGNKYSLSNTFFNRNINFHNAVTFAGQNNRLALPNFQANQATFLGIFYPNYNVGETSGFYSLKYNGQDVFSFLSNLVKDNGNLSYNPDFRRNGQLFETAMKTGTYYRAFISNNHSIWGETKESELTINFSGLIPELIMYNRVLTPEERDKVETYLSIKYGITRPEYYLGSTGKILWDKNSSKFFYNRVCAIGKDLNGAINQQYSNSTYNDGGASFVSYEHDSNHPVTDSIGEYRSLTIGFEDRSFENLADKTFLFWGDNNANLAMSNTFDNQTFRGELQVVNRSWKILTYSTSSDSLRFQIGGDLLQKIYTGDLCEKPSLYFLVFTDSVRTKATRIIPSTYFDEHCVWHPPVLGIGHGSWTITPPEKTIWRDIPLSTNENGIAYFTFGKAKRLRFVFKYNNAEDWDEIYPQDIEHFFIDANSARYPSGGLVYRFGNAPLIQCQSVPNTKCLQFYLDGGIAPFTYTVTKDDQPVVSGTLQRRVVTDKLFTISNLPYQQGETVKYILTVKDQTNQVISLPVQIK